MRGPDPAEYAWWLASRASGIVALLCITASVAIGLAMACRFPIAPKSRRLLLGLHQHTALVGLVSIAVHGITLLGDAFLRPGLHEIAVPFLIEHERVWTGLGVVGGWLAAILGLSYWARDRIGAARWRSLHRATIAVYALSVAHALGAGTDAATPWMRLMMLATGAPVVFLFVLRLLGGHGPPRPAAAARPFRRLRVAAITSETPAVRSFALEAEDGRPLPGFEPGQFVTLRAEVAGRGSLVRSYSLSTAADPGRYRVSVKREPEGAMSGHLHGAVGVGDVLEVAEPKGAFTLDRSSPRPVLLVSAGIGATPVLAMLAALARDRDRREVWWIHGARSGADHAFRDEARGLVEQLPSGRLHVRYTRPGPADEPGEDFHATGRITAEALLEAGVPIGGDFYVCGPERFIGDLRDGLAQCGVPEAAVRSERFSAGPGAPTPSPRSGGTVDFAHSGVTARWEPHVSSLLELAEGCGVAAPYSCRVGECHACATEVLDGRVCHAPEPGAAPQQNKVLLCCARPEGDVRLAL